MGVPKFFRWVAERCPTVITPFRDSPPPVDNLYLDMNGIIHNCSHTNDVDATQKSATEKVMVEAMFAYLEKLFNAIQPRKCFFLAVDGVAPRAKMNQQRQRRYRSGYELMVARQEALARGDDVPDEKDVFDSNCITPGTGFMVRVSEQFQYFITMKIASDPAWQNCQVVYSGHDNPGEGEHKIVDFIRRRKMQPGYSPNETHCMYGLDADLVMLALATHEPHFVLLREVVTFGPGQESRRVREQREEDEANGIIADKSYRNADEFVLLHVNVLRDYLDLDVRNRLGAKLPGGYDLERFLDDFVLMCFFVGNDFLPTIPTLSIFDGGLLQMLDIYCQRILGEGRYLTNAGKINWRAVELWLQGIGELELSTIKQRQQQEEEYQRKAQRRDSTHEAANVATVPVGTIEEYKEHFYSEKHGFEKGWDPHGKDMTELKLHYVEGLLWVMGYYYQGPPSWKWFFPHHYAPMASDLVNLPAIAEKVEFDPGTPFLPHQQLLAVLPPMSYRSMPRAYWPLMLSDKSPLKKFFPEILQIDREGARAPWEGIVLIPFIDERVLLAAYQSVQNKVSPEDAARNCVGPATLFSFDPNMSPRDVPNEMFGPLRNVRVRQQAFEFPPMTTFVPRLCPGVAIGEKQLEGFSSLHTKWDFITLQRETGVVTIFGMPTRKESIILALKDSMNAITVTEALPLVGQEVLVGFPHFRRARVASISDKRTSVRAVITQDGTFCGTETKELNRDESLNFTKECDTHTQYMKEKLGIAVDRIYLLVYVNLFTTMRLTRKGRIVRSFSKDEVCYTMQLVARLQDVDMIEDSRYVERDRVEGDISLGTRVVFVGPEPKNKKSPMQVYGSAGFVFEPTSASSDMYAVAVRVYQEPLALPPSLLSFAAPCNWMALHEVASELSVGSLALRLLTGSLRTTPQYGSREVGLGIVFSRNHLVRIGYAKLVRRQTNAWAPYNEDVFVRLAQNAEPSAHYLDNTGKRDFLGRSGRTPQYTTWFSREAVALIRRYVQAFLPLVKRLESGTIAPQALEPPQFMTGGWQEMEVDDVLREMEAFIEASGIRDVPLLPSSDDAFPREYLQELEDELDRQQPRATKEIILNPVVKRHLYFPLTRSSGGHLTQLPLPQEQTFRLGVRVVNCRAVGCVPFGAVGTIVRLLSTSADAEVVYDEPFTGGSHFEGRLGQPRGALSRLSSLLVLNRPGDDGGGGGAAAEAERNTVSILRALVQKSQQQQKGAAPAADGGVAIPKPRSAVEDATTSPTATGMASTPAAVTMSGGAGGIRLADLVGKLKASPEHSVAAPLTPPTLAEEQKGFRPSPATAKPQFSGATANSSGAACNNNNSNDNNDNQKRSGDNTRAAAAAAAIAPPQTEARTVTCVQSENGNGAAVGARPRTNPRAGGSPEKQGGDQRPKMTFTIPRGIASGEFTIRRGEAVPLFRQLLKLRLSEELGKTPARE
ncbi:putative 5'-3' exonuclease [Trypanosoma conorhini]|uniref:5'-3' exoribonuclease 2 n=1 Tax=Trypanosoma conorhini TaxID=83891 RepID=A0A422PWP5_9TRYP|nr:putative 5'-3' exonuclease [Trypanosoma conorhini]RNF21897.1 putative 5'-3' exonuclease [Trypanosoma conorhini]